MSRRGVSCRDMPRLLATCRVNCRAQYPVKLLEFLDPALNRVSVDEVFLADLRIDGDAGEVALFAIPLHGSDGARHASLGKDHRCFFGRQGMMRLVAFRRVIARRVVYGVVHTYSKRTTQTGWGNGGYPQFGGKPTFKPQSPLFAELRQLQVRERILVSNFRPRPQANSAITHQRDINAR